MTLRQAGLILVTLSALGWSTAGLFTRLVTADAWAIAGWRGVFSASVVALWLMLRERGGLVRGIARLRGPGWAVATVSTLGTITYVAALRETDVADVMVIYATSPFVAAILAWLLMREAPARSTLLAAAVALTGVAIMVGGAGTGSAFVGIALSLAMTAAMALLTVISRRHRDISMIPATGVSAIQLAVVGLLMTAPLAVPPEEIAILAAFGIVQATSFALYLEGARRLAAAQTALISALDVPFSPLWVWLLVSEAPTSATVIGGTVVLAAVLGDILRGMLAERARACRGQ